MSSLCYLSVRVEPGTFRGEYLVRASGLHPDEPGRAVEAQLFADEHEVVGIDGVPSRGHPVPAWLRVSLASVRDGIARLVLPQSAVPVGTRLLVNAAELRAEVVTLRSQCVVSLSPSSSFSPLFPL